MRVEGNQVARTLENSRVGDQVRNADGWWTRTKTGWTHASGGTLQGWLGPVGLVIEYVPRRET